MSDQRRRRGRDRRPRPVAGAVERVRSDLAPPTLLAKVQQCWLEAVGQHLAEQAQPVGEREGIVTVSCRSATWSAELEMLAPDLLERVNDALSEGAAVQGLKFTTRPS